MLVVRGGVWFVIPSVAEESASDKSVSDSKWGPMSSYESEWGPMRLLQTTKTPKLIETHQKIAGYIFVTSSFLMGFYEFRCFCCLQQSHRTPF